MGKLIAAAAASPGHFDIEGRVEPGSGDHALDIPAMAVNIGGIGQGYFLRERIDWDPTAAANHDGTLDAGLSLGDDVTVFAVQDPSGFAGLVASLNTTAPDGYSTTESRRIAGFHFGRVRPLDKKYDTSYVPDIKLVPNSVWDHDHRPVASPYGMAELPSGIWISIYQLSPGSGTGLDMVPVSKYGVQPIKDDIYSRDDLPELLDNAGMWSPTSKLFRKYARGAPQGNDGDNDLAWSATTNSGPTQTGTVAKAVSIYNICDAAGNLWDWLNDEFDTDTANAWDASVVDGVGAEGSFDRGEVNHGAWRGARGGGHFGYGVRVGARTVGWGARPWYSVGHAAPRGASDPLKRGA